MLGRAHLVARCGRPDREIDDVLVEHHEGEPPIAIERVLVVVVEDRLLLLRLEPVIAAFCSGV